MVATVTHAELVERAARWLRRQGYGVVLTEFHTASPEVPDAIGFNARWSALVECKTSRSDFYRDAKKPGRPRGAGEYARLRAQAGLGRQRYYMAAPGVLSVDLVREHRPRWGLLEAHPRTVRAVLRAEPFGMETAWRELPLLYSYVRRIAQYGLPLDLAQLAVMREAETRKVRP